MTRTPFDAVYFPAENQGHVAITPENAAWLLFEIPPPPTAIADETLRLPATLRLHANVPNPFNPTTTLGFDLPRAGAVELAIHDARGRLVAQLVRGDRSAGRHALVWDGRTQWGTLAASGTYLCTLKTDDGQVTRRMTLVR